MSERWMPDGWRGRPAQQMPVYADAAALEAVERQLAGFPPLVFAGEARKLKRGLAKVAPGEAFLLQGGDCAESFAEHSRRQHPRLLPGLPADGGRAHLRGLCPVVKVGRIAGQFAKPRSTPTETVGGVELPSYRGDIVNDIASRRRRAGPIRGGSSRPTDSPPRRSTCCAPSRPAAMPTSRTCITGCWASLRTARNRRATSELADRISEALDFMRAIGIDPETHPEMRVTDFYTSHEALLLGFEQALTRVDSTSGRLVRDLRPLALDR